MTRGRAPSTLGGLAESIIEEARRNSVPVIVMMNLSEDEKRRVLGKMQCTNLRNCTGYPDCYANHPPGHPGHQPDTPTMDVAHSDEDDLLQNKGAEEVMDVPLKSKN